MCGTIFFYHLHGKGILTNFALSSSDHIWSLKKAIKI